MTEKNRGNPYEQFSKQKLKNKKGKETPTAPAQDTAMMIKDLDKLVGEATYHLRANGKKIEGVQRLEENPGPRIFDKESGRHKPGPSEFQRYQNFKQRAPALAIKIGDQFRAVKDEAKQNKSISSATITPLLASLQEARVLIADSSKLIEAKTPKPPTLNRW
jgi:hypothetical protein